jgi:NADPH:quinone reductase-like Zn-dependent oxidoreductase
MLAGLLPLITPYGNVAICGNAGGIGLESTVMPFIIRGVSLLGIASAGTARAIRGRVWHHLASDWKPRHLDRIATREITLAQLPEVFEHMLAGESFGRTIVRMDHV